MLYSKKVERASKFKLALRIGIPVLILISIIVFKVIEDNFLSTKDIVLLILSIFISIYFIFFMILDALSQKMVDPISQAFSRDTILEILKKDIKNKNPYTIILISIDNLVDINDRYGLKRGDNILKEFVNIIDNFFNKKYKRVPIGHYKGGEFLIGINDDSKNIKLFLEKFIKEYDNQKIDDIDINIFATFVDKSYSDDIEKVIEYLYQIYSEYKNLPTSKRALIAQQKKIEANRFERLVLDMIDNKRLSIRFQPAINLNNNRFELVEVVVKLLDEDGSIIHPSQFMPIVNRLGFEKKFDKILIEKILQIIEENSLPKDIFYSFNISPFSIRDKEFTKDIEKNLKFNNINFLVLELFENRPYKDISYYKYIIKNYKKIGFKISFDNFGSYNASIEYIKEIKPDFIYFDKYFTKFIDDEIYKNLLKSWIVFFKSLDVKTVIKYVDNREKIEIFKNLGVDFLEGYAIANPLSVIEFKKFLEKSNEIWRERD